MPASTPATSGATSPTAASILPASPAAHRSATIGRAANSCSAAKPTSRPRRADDTFAPWKFSNPWFGTLRGRAGYALNNILFYGTLGMAYGELSGQLNSLDENKTLVGWTGGLGMEVGFNQKWSAKVEYLYMDLGDRAYTITGVNNGLQSNMLRFGVNYHF